VNNVVRMTGELHLLDHKFLDRGLDFGNPSLGVKALSNNEMDGRISALLSSLDCLVGISNSFLDVEAVQVDFMRRGILVVLCRDRQIGPRGAIRSVGSRTAVYPFTRLMIQSVHLCLMFLTLV